MWFGAVEDESPRSEWVRREEASLTVLSKPSSPRNAGPSSVIQRDPGNVRLMHVIRVDADINTVHWETRSLGSRG